MLLELVVENFAVVERLRLRFHSGLNVLTGETGSGKSLVVDALGLLLGGRASNDLVRTGAARAMVSGIFDLPTGAEKVIADAGIDAEDGELLIEREILASGKSRAFAGGRPVTAAFLRELGATLGDIHGQHDQQRLFYSDSQRELLDESGGVQIEKVRKAYREWRAVEAQLQELARVEQEKFRLMDLWSMQRKEIEALDPKPGEDETLENERRVLKNVAKLQENSTIAFEALADSPESAGAKLRIATKRLDELARIDEGLKGLAEMLKPVVITVDEVSRELSHYLSRLDGDPAKLEAVETRLAHMDRLKKKYGNSIDEIQSFLGQVISQINAVETAGERRAELEAASERLRSQYQKESEKVRADRQKAARALERSVEAELTGLAMKGTRFGISLTSAPPSETGIDAVEFRIAANLGEDPRPLEKIASGGELSRIALALKTCAVPKESKRTLVFDEVDAGVGGSVAETVGRRLKQLAGTNQVLCVTHLAQIAGFADFHYVVSKRETNGRTVSEVVELTQEARTPEIARMLSGQRLSDEALKHAGKLMEEYSRSK